MPVEQSPRTKRAHGRTLTEQEIRDWRDLVLGILFEVGGMSIPDVMAVMNRRLCERQIRNRRDEVVELIRRHGVEKVLEHLSRKRHEQDAG